MRGERRAGDKRASTPGGGSQVVLCSEEDSGEGFDNSFGGGSIGCTSLRGRARRVWRRGSVAAGENRAGEVSDTGNDDGEVVTTFPEAVIGGLVAEDLVWEFSGWGYEGLKRKLTSIKPTTIERDGICEEKLISPSYDFEDA